MPAKKRPALLYLQIAWPSAAIALLIQSMAVTWLGGPAAAATWAGLLPILSGLVLAMGAAAGGGPLVADQIKARAGTLGKEGG